MAGLTLPFQQTVQDGGGGNTIFGITCLSEAGTCIAGTSYGSDRYNDQPVGVNGVSDIGIGVQGSSQSGVGVHAYSTGSGSGVEAYSESGRAVVATAKSEDAINGTSSAPTHAGVSANNDGGGYGLWASSPNTAGNGGIGVYATGAKFAGLFDGAVQVNGTVTATQDVLLGSDCAEDFDVVATEEIDAGMVMVLAEGGALEPCGKAYDKRVAGVISGAGDYRPGVILGRSDASEKRMPLALTGKVYCNVDAAYGSIEIGDLVTTSPTRGHAMRVGDPSTAFGAVIGKALRPLTEGRDLIPILVALQ